MQRAFLLRADDVVEVVEVVEVPDEPQAGQAARGWLFFWGSFWRDFFGFFLFDI